MSTTDAINNLLTEDDLAKEQRPSQWEPQGSRPPHVYEQKLRSQITGAKSPKNTPRAVLGKAVERLREAASSVSRLRDEMVGPMPETGDENIKVNGEGFFGEVALMAEDIERLASRIEADANVVLNRF